MSNPSTSEAVRETIADAQAIGAKMMRVRMPFLAELRDYSGKKFHADLVAGATLTLIAIPQAIAFALILNLPPQPVIVSVIIGGFVGALFFSSRHHVFGPTSSISLIMAATILAQSLPLQIPPLRLAVMMAFLIGSIQLVAGLLNFGEITKFISRSVVIAYSAGIGLLLIGSQLHNLLGYPVASAQSFVQSLVQAAGSGFDGTLSAWGLIVGLLSLLVFYLVQRLRPGWPEALIGLGVMAGLAKIAAVVDPDLPLKLLRDESAIGAVLPVFAGLQWHGPELAALPVLFTTAVAIAILGMLEAAAITKSLATKSGQHVEPNQELVGMGAANIACALFGAVPGSSSFARSAVNYQSGAATQLSAMFSSGVVLAGLFFITPIVNYIPVATLAALLIRVGAKMINWHQIRICCRSTRSDAIVFTITLGAALFLKLDTAIYVGIGVALALFLQKTSMPLLVEYTFNDSGNLAELTDPTKRQNPFISIIHVEGELFFGAADIFQEQVRRQAEDQAIRVFILRMKNARNLDASTVLALESLHEYLRSTSRHLLISGITDDVRAVLFRSGLLAQIGEENIFPTEAANPTASTKRALERATNLLQTKKAEIRIFYDRPQKA